MCVIMQTFALFTQSTNSPYCVESTLNYAVTTIVWIKKESLVISSKSGVNKQVMLRAYALGTNHQLSFLILRNGST